MGLAAAGLSVAKYLWAGVGVTWLGAVLALLSACTGASLTLDRRMPRNRLVIEVVGGVVGWFLGNTSGVLLLRDEFP
jgi:hypothetical protein